jgi:hypothetical protein
MTRKTDTERLMKLWREDLQRTDYGAKPDPTPPLVVKKPQRNVSH